jgi:hypothetical protein
MCSLNDTFQVTAFIKANDFFFFLLLLKYSSERQTPVSLERKIAPVNYTTLLVLLFGLTLFNYVHAREI